MTGPEARAFNRGHVDGRLGRKPAYTSPAYLSGYEAGSRDRTTAPPPDAREGQGTKRQPSLFEGDET